MSDNNTMRQTAARAFVRSLNILLKFARMYDFGHPRTARQYDTAWSELQVALGKDDDSGMLLAVSGDQLLHEMVKIAELSGATVREVMQTRIIGVEADTTVRDFRASIAARHHHTIYPVYDHAKVIGTIATGVLPRTDPTRWDTIKVGELTARNTSRVAVNCDLAEALRLLVREGADQMLLVTDETESLLGIVTKTDILRSLRNDNPRAPSAVAAAI